MSHTQTAGNYCQALNGAATAEGLTVDDPNSHP